MSPLIEQLSPAWKNRLRDAQTLLRVIDAFLAEEESKQEVVYPARDDIFNALNQIAPEHVKVVILGQDPYHNVGQAHGYAFSVPYGVPVPKSLNNIYKELVTDVQFNPPQHGNLQHWVDQGVLLLNSVLTVRAHEAASHRARGWELFTDDVLKALNNQSDCIVFLLWGKTAQEKGHLITAPQHRIFKAPHPSPLSAHRGFFGCQHFSRANTQLELAGRPAIDWQLPF